MGSISQQPNQTDPEKITDIIDRTSIAMESLRTQWRTVAHLGTHERMAISQLQVYGPMPMSELAARISLSRAAVTSLVDRLEAERWVRRSPDDNDRRRTVLELLPRAREVFSTITQDFETELRETLDTMSSSDRSTVVSFLTRASAIAERHADELRATATERALV